MIYEKKFCEIMILKFRIFIRFRILPLCLLYLFIGIYHMRKRNIIEWNEFGVVMWY